MPGSSRHPLDLTGKVALVTGGNSGIGMAAATALARAGAAVAIWGRRQDRNEAAVDALRKFGPPVHGAAVDITAADQVEEGFHDVVAALGRVDCVFANAGNLIPSGPFLDITADARTAQFAAVLDGTWRTVACGLRHMVARAEQGDPGGSIVVTGSLATDHGAVGTAHYGAAKAALIGVVKSVAVEFGRHGVRANVINPGYIAKDDGSRPFADQLARRAPIPRYGLPAEVAGAVVYLASDAAAYHTGDVITIDGGWTSTMV
jgi:NAD(P)-dependent dehydrogenase (short-subunit alcohol dehydrogenase family)